MNKKFFISKFVALSVATCAVPMFGDLALSERSYDFSERLNEFKMFDYAEHFLKKEIAKSPDGVDLLKIALAKTYIGWKKVPLAEVLIAEIKPTSKYYSKAQFIIGMSAIKKGKLDLGIDTLQKYVDYYKHNDMGDEAADKEVATAVQYLKWGYEQKGDVTKAENALDVLFIRGVVNENESNYSKLKAKLDAAEKMKEKGIPGWEIAVRETIESKQSHDSSRPKQKDGEKDYKFRTRLLVYIKEQKAAGKYETSLPSFEELRWFGRGAIYAHSFIQAARANFLLGDIDKAVSELKSDSEFIKSVDKQYADAGQAGSSPGAGLRYWSAKIYHLKAAEQTGANKVQYLTFAFKMFNSVVLKNSGYVNGRKAYEQALKIQKELEGLGSPVSFPEGFEPPAQRKVSPVTAAIKIKMKSEKYSEAIPMLNKVLFANRKADGIIDCYQQLSIAYLKTDRDLEAMAIAMFMLDYYKKDQYTPMALIDIGNKLWGKGEKVQSIEVYDKFLTNYPAHEHTPAIATKIALFYYKKALAIAKTTKGITNSVEKQKKIDEAKVVYNIAADKFDWVIKNCAGSSYITTAHYVQASCFTSTKNYDGSISAYSAFIEDSEKSSMKDVVKMVKAKMGLSSALFQAGQNDKKTISKLENEAISAPKAEKESKLAEKDALIAKSKEKFSQCLKNLQELTTSWLAKDGIAEKELKNPKLQKTIRSAKELIAYAYDAADKKKEATEFFQAFIDAYPNDKKVPAAMSRKGMIFAELGDFDKSAEILGELSKKFPESKEAKSALFTLAKNMYDMKMYDKAIDRVKEIFAKNQSLTVQKLRWILQKFAKCEGKSVKEGSLYALKAGDKLLALLKEKPVYSDWMGATLANSLKGNPTKLVEQMNIIKESVQYDAGNAAFYAESFKSAKKYLDEVLLNKKSPYYYKAKFLRAVVCQKLTPKDWKTARMDLSDINMAALQSSPRKFGLAAKADCLKAATYEAEGDDNKAFGGYKMLATSVMLSEVIEKEDLSKMSDNEKSDFLLKEEWEERAVYKVAVLGKSLGKKDDIQKAVKAYKLRYPNGSYITEINKIK